LVIKKKFVTAHGNMNVNLVWGFVHTYLAISNWFTKKFY